MADFTLKDILEDLHTQLQREAAANFRSLSQEALARIQRTFDLDDRLSTSTVDRLIDEAIDSGAEEELTREQFDAARRKARTESLSVETRTGPQAAGSATVSVAAGCVSRPAF